MPRKFSVSAARRAAAPPRRYSPAGLSTAGGAVSGCDSSPASEEGGSASPLVLPGKHATATGDVFSEWEEMAAVGSDTGSSMDEDSFLFSPDRNLGGGNISTTDCAMELSFDSPSIIPTAAEVASSAAAIDAYSVDLHTAIDAEYEEDVNQHQALLSRSREDLEGHGFLLSNLHVVVEASGLGCVMKVRMADGGPLPDHHCFKAKDAVTMLLANEAHLSISPCDDPRNKSEAVSDSVVNLNDTFDSQDGSDMTADELECYTDQYRPPQQQLAATSRPGKRTSASDRQREYTTLERKLQTLGFHKAFIANVSSVTDTEITIKTRQGNSHRMVDQSQAGDWAMIDALQDITYRRQRCAVEEICDHAAVQDGEPVTDDNRLVKILIGMAGARMVRRAGDPSGDVHREAVIRAANQLSEESVSWMTEPGGFSYYSSTQQRVPFAAIHDLLEKAHQQGAINESQLAILKGAMGRSLTLLQGPPGTGKTRTEKVALTSLVRVFCHSGSQGGAHGFDIPSFEPLVSWSQSKVGAWLESCREDPASGITAEVIEVAKESLKGVSGKTLAAMSRDDFCARVQKHVEIHQNWSKRINMKTKKSSPVRRGVVTYDAEVCRLASSVWEMRAQLNKAVTLNQQRNAIAATLHRDVRVLMCADSNQAVDNMLRLLHNDSEFRSEGYTIVRLGDGSKVTDAALSAYCIETQIADHEVAVAAQEALIAIEDLSLNYTGAHKAAVGKLAARLKALKVSLLEDARTELRPCMANHLKQIAGSVIGSMPEDLVGQERTFTRSKNENRRTALKSLKRTLRDGIRNIIKLVLLTRAQVVLSTNTSAGEIRQACKDLDLSFPFLILDESGQACEASSLIPLSLKPQWVLMGGDLKQLPPTLRSDTAQRIYGYLEKAGGSIHGNLVHELRIFEQRLHVQYRMHPSIRSFVGRAFYADLRPALTEPAELASQLPRPQPKGYDSSVSYFRWPSPAPLAFFEVNGQEEQPRFGQSYFNVEEANACLRLLMVFAADPSVRSVAILTPYRAQAELIQGKLQKSEGYLQRIRSMGGFHASHFGAYSIDSYQGQEADLIILSPVRSSLDTRTIGHTADYRRINVAVSRAKRGLIIAGSARTLTRQATYTLDQGRTFQHNFWPQLVDWMYDNGCFVRAAAAEQDYLRTRIYHPDELRCTVEDMNPQQHGHQMSGYDC